MTDEEIRAEIVKLAPELFEESEGTFGKCLYWAGTHRCLAVDPLDDLNAVARVEAKLTEDQRRQYAVYFLPMVVHVSGRDVRTKAEDFTLVTATARQRCIALLKVHGKL